MGKLKQKLKRATPKWDGGTVQNKEGIRFECEAKNLTPILRKVAEEATKDAIKEVVSALEEHNIKVVISVIPGDDGPMIEILEAKVKKTETCE